jgi:hypothetical protein
LVSNWMLGIPWLEVAAALLEAATRGSAALRVETLQKAASNPVRPKAALE